ncbi:MAG: adenylate kinase family protein [Methanotrichaceae archaeon]
MLIALTGTPGTGKTTVAQLLPYRVIDINALIKEEGLYTGIDAERDCLIADMDALEKRINDLADKENPVVLEGHFSHQFADVAIVLRTSICVLGERLAKRGYPEKKIRENLEAEALDVVLVEAVERCDQVHKIDTTETSPQEVADQIIKMIEGEIEPTLLSDDY